MKRVKHIAILVAVGILAVTVTGCSRDLDDVDSDLWQQVDHAESAVYRVSESGAVNEVPTQTLLERLTAVAEHWEEGMPTTAFAPDMGTAVIHNYEENALGESAGFHLFVASGMSDHLAVPVGWGSRPTQVYTCYRVEADLVAGTLWDFSFPMTDDEERWPCPDELVDALDVGAQYRDPAVFAG